MKLLLLAITLIAFTGCNYNVDQGNLQEAEEICKDKEGVYKIRINSDAKYVYCKDGFSDSISY